MPETPPLAVDLIIRISGESDRVVLIERRNPPPGWALPGGFVDLGETVAAAAEREAREETGLVVTLVTLLGVSSAPDRDPRGHTVSLVFVAAAYGVPEAGDDAATARAWSLDALPPLAFDHQGIVADYIQWLATGARAPLTR